MMGTRANHRRRFLGRLAAVLCVLATISATAGTARAQTGRGWRRGTYYTAPRYSYTTPRYAAPTRYYTAPRYYTTPRTFNGWGTYRAAPRYVTPRNYYSGPPVYFAPPMM